LFTFPHLQLHLIKTGQTAMPPKNKGKKGKKGGDDDDAYW
jgi:hypothetical protein